MKWVVYEDRTSTTLLPASADPAAYPWDGPAAVVHRFDAPDTAAARRAYREWVDRRDAPPSPPAAEGKQ